MNFPKFQKSLFSIILLLLFFNVQAQEEGGIVGGCSDGIDNDGDGLIDCLDSDCGAYTIACPAFSFPSSCSPSGGIRGEIISTETAFRNSNGAAATFIIPNGATSAILYTSSTILLDNNSNNILGNEDFINSSSNLNLANSTSSGIITYAQSTRIDGTETTLFGWKNVAFGNKVSTGAAAGHDFSTPTTPLNDITFSVSGNVLTVTEDNINIKTVYLIEFISGSTDSYLSNGFDALALNENDFDGAVLIPAGSDAITITVKGTANKDHSGLTGGTEEPYSDMRFLLDLDLNTAAGYVTVMNGGGAAYHSNYAFEGYDLNSATDSLWDAPIIAGDYVGKNRATDGSSSTANFKLNIDGDSIRITRDSFYGADFDDVYIFEFYKKSGLQVATEFVETSLAFYDKGSPNGSVEQFTIPGGSNFAIFKFGGLAENSNSNHNENPVNAYAFIDLVTEKAYGYYFQQVGFSSVRRDHNFAFTAVPLDKSSTRTHANTIGKNSANAQYDIEFELSLDKTILSVYSYFGLVSTSYTAVMQADFYGTKSDIAFDPNNIVIANNGSCATVDISVELCNPGGGNSPQGMPISFYEGDPTIDASAIYLYTQNFTPNVDIGQCASDVVEVDLELLTNNNIDVTIIINDDGSFASGIGNPIGSTFDLVDLAIQSNSFSECDYTNNLTTRTINVNNCPITMKDNEVTNMNESIIVDLQSNDNDPDGDGLMTSIFEDAGNGTTTLINGDSIYYQPDPGFFGIDTIVYQLTDGNGGIGTDTIFIEVQNVLPVSLIDFSVAQVDCKNKITWQSAIEINFSHYEMERSTDGARFQKMAIIEKKNEYGIKRYEFIDQDPYKFSYYRLKLINLNETFSFSQTVNMESSCHSTNTMTVFPNPIDNDMDLQLNIHTTRQQAAIKIINIAGALVKEVLFDTRKGSNALTIEIEDIPSGTYYILNTSEPSAQVAKFVKVY